MRKSEITLGGVYSNGKGRVRKVVAEGAEYVLYDSQEETDNLRYEIIHDGSKNNRTAGQQGNITRSSFASWAKDKVE
ncbi:hypothetical protein [Rossellomorea marisflavi]|uniref:hypothetical protein n=1 Tax=Rossellomorea marisflavi TaxID=189381 RepID=UPI003FA06B2A